MRTNINTYVIDIIVSLLYHRFTFSHCIRMIGYRNRNAVVLMAVVIFFVMDGIVIGGFVGLAAAAAAGSAAASARAVAEFRALTAAAALPACRRSRGHRGAALALPMTGRRGGAAADAGPPMALVQRMLLQNGIVGIRWAAIRIGRGVLRRCIHCIWRCVVIVDTLVAAMAKW